MKKRCYFNLVELIVVIGIIGILAGLIFPIVGHVKEKGKRTACMSNLRQLQVGVSTFRASRKDRYPDWLSNLYKKEMKGSAKVYLCPNDPRDDVRSANSYRNKTNGVETNYDNMTSTFDSPDISNEKIADGHGRPSDIDGLHVSYIYEFCGGKWPSSWGEEKYDDDTKVTVGSGWSWQKVKIALLKECRIKKKPIDTRLPMIRCGWHAEWKKSDSLSPFLNVSTTGNSYLSRAEWQKGVDI